MHNRLRIVQYELRIVQYELRIVQYELRIVQYELYECTDDSGNLPNELSDVPSQCRGMQPGGPPHILGPAARLRQYKQLPSVRSARSLWWFRSLGQGDRPRLGAVAKYYR